MIRGPLERLSLHGEDLGAMIPPGDTDTDALLAQCQRHLAAHTRLRTLHVKVRQRGRWPGRVLTAMLQPASPAHAVACGLEQLQLYAEAIDSEESWLPTTLQVRPHL